MSAYLPGSVTWDATTIADGNMESKDVTVTGAALGDYVLASIPLDLVDLQLTAEVTSANTVTATLSNSGAASTDLASTTLRVFVISKSGLGQS